MRIWGWTVLVAVVALAIAPVRAQDVRWPHEASDLQPDPSVVYGRLANGMRYALKRNGTPKDAVTVYLRIAAGSLHESDDQRGLAHFLEHLAFQGSANVARGELLKMLQRLGARPGADANAYTSFDETVYTLELPRADAASLDTAFMLLREIADRLLLTAEAMESERGVVLEEMRESDRPAARSARQHLAAMLPGLKHNTRWPIGDKAVIEKAPVALVRKYYQQYYRPERALLIVVGEIDPAAIEAKIGALFSDWKQPGAAGVEPDQGRFVPGPMRADSASDPALRESVNINHVRAGTRSAPDKATYQAQLRRNIAIALLNQRLLERARKSESPFEAAGAGVGQAGDVARYLRLGANAMPGRWDGALQALEQEARRLTTFGANRIELNREIRRARVAGEEALASAPTFTNTFYANEILGGVRSKYVFMNVEQHIALRDEVLQSLSVEDVGAILRDQLAGDPALLFVTSPKALTGGEGAITGVYREAQKTAVAAPPVVAAMPFPYTRFGRPGAVSARREIDVMGASEILFENGIRLHVKTTDFRKNDVRVAVRFAGGLDDFAKDKTVYRSAYMDTLILGGLNEISFNNLVDTLGDRSIGLTAAMSEDAYELSGGTTARDLALQLQVFAAYATDAAYQTAALDSVKSQYQEFWRRRRANPRTVLGTEAGAVLRPNDKRWALPSLDSVNATTVDEIKTALQPVLKGRPVDITIVGDVGLDAAIATVASTFGSLPKRTRRYTVPAGARDVRFPAARQQIVLQHDGRADHALAYVAWPGPDYRSDVRRARAFRLLREVMASELLDKLRGLGKAYTPSAVNLSSRIYPGYGYLSVSAETTPGDLDLVYREIDAIVAAFKAGAISDDMILRARTPIVASLESARRTNGYWLAALVEHQTDVRAGAEEASLLSDYQSIGKDEIVAVARAFLDDARRVEIRVLPASAAISLFPLHKNMQLVSDWLTRFESLGQLPTGTSVPLTLDAIPADRASDAFCAADTIACHLAVRGVGRFAPN